MKILCFNGRFCNHIVRFSKVYHLRLKSISFTTQKYVIYGSKVWCLLKCAAASVEDMIYWEVMKCSVADEKILCR